MTRGIYLIATLDTKGEEADFVRGLLESWQIPVILVDAGCLGEASVACQITRDQVFQAAGKQLADIQRQADRGSAVDAAATGVTRLVTEAHEAGQLLGVIGLGGSAGTTIATAAMRNLPLGLPKLMVSTLASGDVRAFVGVRDIMMLNSVVDILGLNRISRQVLRQAAAAMAGMVLHQDSLPRAATDSDRPLVAATMFGVTTPCVERARKVLEASGYEVLVFHATGTGGQTMEGLIQDGLISGVLDLTTTEIADELVGGVLSAGPERLTAAAAHGIPQVVSVGATDMVNFWAMPTVPERFQERSLHKHNDNVTLMRTTVEESSQIGKTIAQKVSQSIGPYRLVLPLQGVSAIDKRGQPFDDPAAREALFAAIRNDTDQQHLVEVDAHINDAAFAEHAAELLLGLMKQST